MTDDKPDENPGFARPAPGNIPGEDDFGSPGEQGPGQPASGDRVVGEQGPDHPEAVTDDPPTPKHGFPAQPAAAAADPAQPSEWSAAASARPGDARSGERLDAVAQPGAERPDDRGDAVPGPGVESGAAYGSAAWAASFQRDAAPQGWAAERSEWAPPTGHQSEQPPGVASASTPGQQTGQHASHQSGQQAAHQSGQQAVHQTGQQQVLFGTAAPASQTQGFAHHPHHHPQRVAAEPKKRSGALVAGVTALALLVGGGAGAVGGYLVAENQGGSSATALDQKPPAKQASTPAPPGTVEAVADKVLPSVVQLQVRGRSAAGEGSGFVISEDGLIVTNNHVVEAAADGGQITAVFQDGRTARATIVGRDPTSDVAVVKAQDIGGLVVAELGRSDDLRVGQAVVAVGSPFELAGTVTSGIVSALQRPTRAGGEDGSQATVLDAVQTDAAINPGNSGGPLVNMQGQVIGINSAIYSPGAGSGDAGSVGIGFAIPIDQARRTADEIVKTGKATQTILGVSVRNNTTGPGALISEVTPGGAGEKAGLKKGDVITKLDERRIDSADAIVAAVRSHAPGDKVSLVIGDGERTVEATLGGQPVEVN